MFQKFIINRDGVLKFGHVYLHRDMLAPGEQCTYGGGLWKIDEGRGAIVLYGRSFDFGPPDFDYVKKIDWTGLGGTPRPPALSAPLAFGRGSSTDYDIKIKQIK